MPAKNFDHLNTVTERDRLASIEHAPGEIVQVLPGYRIGGTFVADGSEGAYVVMARLGNTADYKLIRLRGDSAQHYTKIGNEWIRALVEHGDWDYIVHASRFVAIEAAVRTRLAAIKKEGR